MAFPSEGFQRHRLFREERPYTISARVTREESDMIDKEAERLGMTRADFFRVALTNYFYTHLPE